MTESLLQALTMLAAALLVLLLPGLAWLAWFPDPERDPVSSLADALALSISFTAVAALALFLFKIQASALLLAAVYAGLAVLCAAGWLRQPPAARRSAPHLAGAVLVLAAVTAWRLYQVRTLVLPSWVDSLHHVLIVRLFLENGGIPASLAPYLPVPFSYHYAFHAVAALFTAASGAAPERAVLVLGQAINALVCLQVYRLGRALWPGLARALAAALLVGFVTQMPAYYATWGRYTLLTGLLILPAGMAAALDLTRRPGRRETVIRLALLTSGLLLSHYLAALLLAFFYVVLAVFWLGGRARQQTAAPALPPLLAAAGLGLLAALPWLVRVWQLNQGSFTVQVNLDAGAPDRLYFTNYMNYLWVLSGPLRNYVLLGLGLAGVILGLWRPAGRRLSAWWLVIILLSLPWGLRLGPFRPDHMLIVWFLPASLCAAHLLISAGEAARSLLSRRLATHPRLLALLAWLLPAAATLGLLAWGLESTRSILNSGTILAQKADLPALAWIQENTPPSARFWINTSHWQGSTYRGVDGGWWITPLTGRGTLLPVVLYATGEPEYVSRTNTWAKTASQVVSCSPEFYETARQAGITHVYLRDGTGTLQPEAADACPGLENLYSSDGVSIYRITAQQE